MRTEGLIGFQRTHPHFAEFDLGRGWKSKRGDAEVGERFAERPLIRYFSLFFSAISTFRKHPESMKRD